MWKSIGRLVSVTTLVLAPMSVAMFGAPAISWADCANGQWWDPKANVCRAPDAPMALPCDAGQWWDPTGNACRPLGQGPQPPGCDPGQWWDPTANVCRALGVGPQPLNCDNGWWWDPTSNTCRPPLFP